MICRGWRANARASASATRNASSFRISSPFSSLLLPFHLERDADRARCRCGRYPSSRNSLVSHGISRVLGRLRRGDFARLVRAAQVQSALSSSTFTRSCSAGDSRRPQQVHHATALRATITRRYAYPANTLPALTTSRSQCCMMMARVSCLLAMLAYVRALVHNSPLSPTKTKMANKLDVRGRKQSRTTQSPRDLVALPASKADEKDSIGAGGASIRFRNKTISY